MIHLLERLLVILGALQPLITFLIGCAAVYVSIKTYKNAKMLRKHTESSQLFSLKREIRTCCTEYLNNVSLCLTDLHSELHILQYKLRMTLR